MFEFTYQERGSAAHVYRLSATDSLLLIQKDNQPQKAYKCVSDYEYTYRIQKTQIKAHDGAAGFVKHVRDCVTQNFAVQCWAVDPIEKILVSVKEVKQ